MALETEDGDSQSLQRATDSPLPTLSNHTKLSRPATWHVVNGQVHNQIDFILTPQRFKSSINKANTRSSPGADIVSSHDLVLTTIKLKLKVKLFTRSPCIQFDLKKPKDPKILKCFTLR